MKYKSIPIAVILTALLGPFGMIYCSAGKAVLALLFWVIVIPFTIINNPSGAFVLSVVFWAFCIGESFQTTREYNEAIDEQASQDANRHQELLAALNSRVGA